MQAAVIRRVALAALLALQFGTAGAADAPPVVAAAASAAPVASAASAQADAQRWDLRDLYPTPAAWDGAYRDVRQRADGLPQLQAGMGASAAAMLQALDTISGVQRTLGRLYVYAVLKGDEDLRDAPSQERRQQVQALAALVDEKTSWLALSIQAVGAERVRAYMAAEPALKARFDTLIDDALRNAPHTLGAEGEALLAAGGVVLAQPRNIFDQLAEAELPRPQVTLAGGKTVTLTTDAFEVARRSAVRDDRKRVFDAFFGGWKQFEGTLGANLAAQVQGDVYAARARRFEGSLDAALFGTNMPPAVYRQLVAQARAGLPTLHRYLRLRKAALGIAGDMAYFDNYPSLVPNTQTERYSVQRSKAITLQALAPLGDQYLGLLKKGFAAQWMDSHPRTAKASGGYMFGSAYDVHPYLLLNHSDDYPSLSTLAHEWGHAVHTLLTTATQPFEKSDYSTFIAESASIGNEMLLSDFMVANARSPQQKMAFLAEAMESIRTTFFRQTMFAEFQLAMHEEVEQGRALSGKRLSALYCGIAKAYYGEAEGVMKIDPAYCVEWAYVSHFFRGYYVWQYATSMVGAAEFTAAIAKEGAPARDRFIQLLKAGGSDYPYPLYLRAGVDLARPEPYRALMARMNRLMDEFEQLAATQPPR